MDAKMIILGSEYVFIFLSEWREFGESFNKHLDRSWSCKLYRAWFWQLKSEERYRKMVAFGIAQGVLQA